MNFKTAKVLYIERKTLSQNKQAGKRTKGKGLASNKWAGCSHREAVCSPAPALGKSISRETSPPLQTRLVTFTCTHPYAYTHRLKIKRCTFKDYNFTAFWEQKCSLPRAPPPPTLRLQGRCTGAAGGVLVSHRPLSGCA